MFKKFLASVVLSLFLLTLCLMSTSSVYALALGGAVGADLPLAHTKKTDPGVAAEGFFRQDPYELRFHYSHIKIDTYSVLVSDKYFFSSGVARPYIEGGLGPLIVDTPHRGLGYGFKPEASVGVDIGITKHFSAGAVTRYFALAYFGNTDNGKFNANHGFSLMGNIIVWF